MLEVVLIITAPFIAIIILSAYIIAVRRIYAPRLD